MLPFSFITRDDPVFLVKELLGKRVLTFLNNQTLTRGVIVEIEAYKGIEDKACHKYGVRRIPRNEAF